MILQPSIIALLLSSTFLLVLLGFAAVFAVKILAGWNLASGSERQLALERRTYLVSTIVAWGFGFQLASLFLFVHTADSLHGMFVGAMCAAGTLYANAWGYPTLVLKILTFLLAGLWLVLNHADSRGYDYPLIRVKYALLLGVIPLVAIEYAAQALFFAGLRPDIITSCCGTLFSAGGKTVASEIAATPAVPTIAAFFGLTAATIGLGLVLVFTGRGAVPFGVLSAASFLVGAVSLVSFISIYFYELPTHHCPFCVLQADYGRIGYVLYAMMLGGAVTGMGAGILAPARRIASLAAVVPRIQRRLAVAACVFFGAYAAIAAARMIFTDFVP